MNLSVSEILFRLVIGSLPGDLYLFSVLSET